MWNNMNSYDNLYVFKDKINSLFSFYKQKKKRNKKKQLKQFKKLHEQGKNTNSLTSFEG